MNRPGSPARAAVRAVIFDAGNTLLRMNYGIIAAHLATRGRAASPEQVEDAELRARVRLDPHLAPGASTESTVTHGRYLRYLLENLAITDDAEIDAIARWRRGYNLPVGLWNRADPQALAALRRVRAAGLVAGVISNSNGSVRSILEETGLAAHLDFIIDSAVVGVEKPDPRIFHLGLREAGVVATRRSTWAISTRWTSWARGRPGSTASARPAASGRRATAASRAGSRKRCAWRWGRPDPALSPEGRGIRREA